MDESCIPQHANERKVRTMNEDEDVESQSVAATDVDTISANDEECDLEELASVENADKDISDDDDDDDDNAEGNRQIGDVDSDG